jgi:hypothetical protein
VFLPGFRHSATPRCPQGYAVVSISVFDADGREVRLASGVARELQRRDPASGEGVRAPVLFLRQPCGGAPHVGLAYLAGDLPHLRQGNVWTLLRDRFREILVERIATLLVNFAILVAMAVVKTRLLHEQVLLCHSLRSWKFLSAFIAMDTGAPSRATAVRGIQADASSRRP